MKKNKTKKPNYFIYKIFILISKFLSKFVYNLKVIDNEIKNVKTPYIVIANHESSIDFIFMAAQTKRRTHFVISNSIYQTMPIKPLLDAVAVIPKQQFQTSITDMKTMKKCLEENRPVVLYPAGLMTETGTSTPMPLGTGKLLKWLNVDVYTAYTSGSYLTNPKWSSKRRKGKITINIKKLYSVEDLANLSQEDIQKEITEKLYFDAYKNNEISKTSFKNGDNIEGLQNVLYWCPKCKNEFTFVNTTPNSITCKYCSNSAVADTLGFLYPKTDNDVIYKHTSDWCNVIINNLRETIINDENYSLSDTCDIHMVDYKKHKFIPVGNGNVKLDRSGFTLTGKINNEEINKFLPISYYPILPFRPNKYFEIQEGNNIYRIYLTQKEKTTKWMNSLKILFLLKIQNRK